MTDIAEDNPSFCSRLKEELSTDAKIFSLEEPNEKYIDLEDGFVGGANKYVVGFYRLAALVFQVIMFVDDIVFWGDEKETLKFHWMYLTQWTWTISLLYILVSLVLTFYRSPLLQPFKNNTQDIHWLVKLHWANYVICSTVGLVVCIMYWLTIYDPEISLQKTNAANLSKHGIAAALIIIDGTFVGSIPVRAKQLRFVLGYGILYLTWSLIHSFSALGNDLDPEPHEDDALYSVLNWKERFVGALIYSTIVMCIVMPLMFMIVWTLSLKCSRRRTTI